MPFRRSGYSFEIQIQNEKTTFEGLRDGMLFRFIEGDTIWIKLNSGMAQPIKEHNVRKLIKELEMVYEVRLSLEEE